MASETKQKDSKLATVIAGVIVLVLFWFFAQWVGSIIFPSQSKQEQRTQQDTSTKPKETNSYENPVNIDSSVLTMSGDAFVDKYKGKYVKISGEIGGTSYDPTADRKMSSVYIGSTHDKHGGVFTDMSSIRLIVRDDTFQNDMAEFRQEYVAEKPVKVVVIALVSQIDNKTILLESHDNTSGKFPPVVKVQ